MWLIYTHYDIKTSLEKLTNYNSRYNLEIRYYSIYFLFKKNLKIPKGQSETVYRRRTDNTMAKRKSTKGQTTIDKTYI